MARMTYDEWKKKKEEPGKGTSESSATAPSSSSTTNGGTSSGRLTYDEWKGNKNSSSLEDWAKSSVSLLNEMQTKSSAWSYKDEHRGYSDQISGLLSQASNWRNQYAGNEEAISYINSVVKALSDTKQKSSRIADSYSKYKTQDEYDTAVREHGYWQEAQGKDYLKLRDEIAKLEPGSEKYEWMKSYAPTTLTKENIDTSLAEVGKEISSLSKFIDEWGNLDVWYNDYVANPSAASYGLTDDQVQERVSMHKAITNRFGSYDNMRATLEAKKEELRNLENHQKYGLLEQNKDFRAVSSDVATELPSGLGMFTADSTYYYINDVDGYRIDRKSVV